MAKLILVLTKNTTHPLFNLAQSGAGLKFDIVNLSAYSQLRERFACHFFQRGADRVAGGGFPQWAARSRQAKSEHTEMLQSPSLLRWWRLLRRQ